MSDAALAAAAALIGVGLSGGVQIGLKAWADHKIRRASLRPVTSELGSRLAWLQQDMRLILLMRSLPGCPAWEKHQDVLARELPEQKWRRVAGAFSAYDLIRSQVEDFDDSHASSVAKLRMLKASLDYARMNVRAGYQALAGQRATEALIAAAPKGEVEVTIRTTSTEETTMITFDRDTEGQPPADL